MMVSTWVAFTMPAEDRVGLVGADVLGALELDLGLVAVEPDDDVDVGICLEALGDAAAPERARAR